MTREILRPCAVRYQAAPKTFNWRIAIAAVGASGDTITTEGGTTITTEGGDTITTE